MLLPLQTHHKTARKKPVTHNRNHQTAKGPTTATYVQMSPVKSSTQPVIRPYKLQALHRCSRHKFFRSPFHSYILLIVLTGSLLKPTYK